MLIAICAEADDVKSLVPKKFVDAKVLMIIDGDTNTLRYVYTKEDEKNLFFARKIVEHDCEVLITGAMDQEPFEIVVAGNVTRYDGSTRKVQRAYDYFKRGTLTLIRDYINGPGAVGHTHDYSCDCGEHSHEEEEREPVFDAVITCAGLSSRMGDFKPLMTLGGRVNLIRQMETFYRKGVRRITLVTGHREEEIRRRVQEYFGDTVQYVFVSNPDYASSQMFDSIRIGFKEALLGELPQPDGIFFVPVDIPLFTGFTVDALTDHFSYGSQDVFRPEYEGRSGHPLLIRSAAVEKILAADDSQGLRSALTDSGVTVASTDVPDAGVILDADTPEEYELLRRMAEERKAPSDETCLSILRWAGAGDDLIGHVTKVAETADEIAAACVAAGADLNSRRIHSAALLHDVLKEMEKHEERGAQMLADLDMAEVGELVRTHSDLSDVDQDTVSDALVVFLADKLVCGDRRVPLEERFEKKRKQFAGNKYALAGLEKRYQMARKAMETATKAGYHPEKN